MRFHFPVDISLVQQVALKTCRPTTTATSAPLSGTRSNRSRHGNLADEASELSLSLLVGNNISLLECVSQILLLGDRSQHLSSVADHCRIFMILTSLSTAHRSPISSVVAPDRLTFAEWTDGLAWLMDPSSFVPNSAESTEIVEDLTDIGLKV